MSKPAKKVKSNKKKDKIVAKLISIEGGKSKKKQEALDKAFDDMFEVIEPGTTAHPDGTFTNQYASHVPTNEEIKNSFIYQDLLKKYRRQQLKANNKRWQHRSVKNKLERMRMDKEVESGIAFVEKAQLEEMLQFGLKMINRGRKARGLGNLSLSSFKKLYFKQAEPWS